MSDLLQEAIEASGGLERWQAAREVIVTGEIGGLALSLRAGWDGEPTRVIRISMAEPQVVFSDYPEAGLRGVFRKDLVRIETEDGSTVVRERRDPRRYFFRYRWRLWRWFRPWDELDVAYFLGYALWNYFLTPYLLTFPGIRTQEIEPDMPGVRRLEAWFPPEIPTHSVRQTFSFSVREDGKAGLLHHLNYTFDIFAYWLRAFHRTKHHKEFSGIQVATFRRVDLEHDLFLRRLRMYFWKESFGMWGDIDNVEYI